MGRESSISRRPVSQPTPNVHDAPELPTYAFHGYNPSPETCRELIVEDWHVVDGGLVISGVAATDSLSIWT